MFTQAKTAQRAVDALIDILDLAGPGAHSSPAATGWPDSLPSLMLLIYQYRYLKQIQSSRQLERNCGRNPELIWLTGRLKPDFKKIVAFEHKVDDHAVYRERLF